MAMKISIRDRHFIAFAFNSHQRPVLASATEKKLSSMFDFHFYKIQRAGFALIFSLLSAKPIIRRATPPYFRVFTS
jgi:hypothetical protein